ALSPFRDASWPMQTFAPNSARVVKCRMYRWGIYLPPYAETPTAEARTSAAAAHPVLAATVGALLEVRGIAWGIIGGADVREGRNRAHLAIRDARAVVVVDVVGGDRPAGEQTQLRVDDSVTQSPAVAEDAAAGSDEGAEAVRVADLEHQDVRQKQAGKDVGGGVVLAIEPLEAREHVSLKIAHVVPGLAGVKGIAAVAAG